MWYALHMKIIDHVPPQLGHKHVRSDTSTTRARCNRCIWISSAAILNRSGTNKGDRASKIENKERRHKENNDQQPLR